MDPAFAAWGFFRKLIPSPRDDINGGRLESWPLQIGLDFADLDERQI
jgi:hypothetical protein